MDEYPEPYQGIIDELNKKIAWCKGRRDALHHGSAEYWSYQRLAGAAVKEAEAWESAAPILADYDAQIEAVAAPARREQYHLSAMVAGWRRAMLWSAVLGVLLLSFSWWASISTVWLPTIGVLLLGLAGLCGWGRARTQQTLNDRRSRADAERAKLTAARGQYLPQAGVGGAAGVGETARVDPLLVPGKVNPGRAGADGVGHPFGGGDTRVFGGPVGEGHNVRR